MWTESMPRTTSPAAAPDGRSPNKADDHSWAVAPRFKAARKHYLRLRMIRRMEGDPLQPVRWEPTEARARAARALASELNRGLDLRAEQDEEDRRGTLADLDYNRGFSAHYDPRRWGPRPSDDPADEDDYAAMDREIERRIYGGGDR